MRAIDGPLQKYYLYRDISNTLYHLPGRSDKQTCLLGEYLAILKAPEIASQEKVNRTIILAAMTILKNRASQ